jgi:prolipoprotein diacylglyceryltransferase
MNGCCHGVACTWPWGVRFPEGSPSWKALGDVAVHPTQLLTSAISLATFALLIAVSRRSPPPGTVFFALLALWSGARLCIDLLRSYPASTLVWPGSGVTIYKHQPIVAALLLAGLAGVIWLRRNRPARSARSARG